MSDAPVSAATVPDQGLLAAFQTWIYFILGLSGAFYVLMTGSLVVHEILGHGLTSVLFGAPGMTFSVSTGFAGWAVGTEPPQPGAVGFITWAGIAVNLAIGLAVLGLLRLRSPRLSPAGLVLYWAGTTELGHALGYTLQGLVFQQGDAEYLPATLGTVGRVTATVVLGVLFLLLARWALKGAAGFIRDHFRSSTPAAFRRDFVLGFTLPMAALVMWAPGLPRREAWTILAFDLAVLVVLFGVTAWCVREMPPHREHRGLPITARWALGWSVAAVATFTAAHFWLSKGVTVYFR